MTSERMSSDSAQISQRERDILRLVALGATNQQIADQLNISINTVKVHLRNIFEKIGAASRTEATVYAIRQGLVQLEGQATTTALSLEPPAEEVVPPEIIPLPNPSITEVEALANSTEAPPLGSVIPTASGASVWPRRGVLLALALGVVLLLGTGVAYLYFQQPGAVATTPQPQANPLNRWKLHSTWPQPRSDFAVAAYDNKLYLIGGSLDNTVSGAVERYDPSKDQLVALNAKPTPVQRVQAVTIGGKIYVPGGEAQDSKVLAICEVYDPRSKQWESLPPLPAPRSRYALAEFEGQLYLFGGWDGSSYRNEVFVFDPRANTWAERTPMRTARANAGAALVESYMYVIGGENQTGPLATNERFDPTSENGGSWESVVPLSKPVIAPAVVGTINSVLLFDPQQRTATEYSPTADAWQTPVSVPADVGLSSRAAALSTSIFLFGPTATNQPGAVSEYQVLYSTLFPIINK